MVVLGFGQTEGTVAETVELTPTWLCVANNLQGKKQLNVSQEEK